MSNLRRLGPTYLLLLYQKPRKSQTSLETWILLNNRLKYKNAYIVDVPISFLGTQTEFLYSRHKLGRRYVSPVHIYIVLSKNPFSSDTTSAVQPDRPHQAYQLRLQHPNLALHYIQ